MKKTILILVFMLTLVLQAQETKRIIIDADTGNEVDDLYAIVRGLIEPSWEVIGLNATQWQISHWAVEKSMEESYRLNEVLLAYLRMNDEVIANRGATARLFDWGNKSNPSQASNFIIEEALKSKNDKLTLVVLGALTNVASAILDEPEITDRIRVYWLGTLYNFDEQVMKTIDFNSVMDIQAVDIMLNSKVDLHIMPHSVSAKMIFDWKETEKRFKGKHDLLDFLLQRWYNHLDGGRQQRTIWDLSLIEAMIHPEYSEKVKITTSKEKGNRGIWIYKNIDAEKMRADFYKTILDYVENL